MPWTNAKRAEVARRRAALPPLEPDAFMAWAWEGEQGTQPATLEDVAFELHEPDVASLRKTYIRIAARVRRNIRLGLDPWEGI